MGNSEIAEASAPQRFTIDDSGYSRIFEVAADEICVASEFVRVSSILLPGLESLDIRRRSAQLQDASGLPVHLVLYETGTPRTTASRRILTRNVLAQMRPGIDPAEVARQSGIVRLRTFAYASDYALFETDGPPDAALELAAKLRMDPRVTSAEPLLGRTMSRRLVPDDPLFSLQWYLVQGDQPENGSSLNLTEVWDTFLGRNVTVSIVDDGLQLDHPDLVGAGSDGLHHDYRDDDDDPNPTGPDDIHGTAVAGLVAARAQNKIGIVGVAPEVALVGVRLIGGANQTDDQSADALLHAKEAIDISNNSWGAPDSGQLVDGPGPLARSALRHGVETGRNGKGIIYVWSAGNGGEIQDNANYDGYANSIYTIAVGGVTDLGTHAAFSEPGACLVVSAPAGAQGGAAGEGIVTIDLQGDKGINFAGAADDLDDRDYTQLFGGTSAAAPMVSGVIALMLEANPELGWRDVQEILVRSAKLVAETDADWIQNGAGLHFNHKFGAGAIDPAAAIQLALRWTNLSPQTTLSMTTGDISEMIPDGDSNGITLEFSSSPLRVEHATMTVKIAHPRRGDLAITLISPSGTRSRLAERHLDRNADFVQWTFTSMFHWAENAQGAWKLQIADVRTGGTGQINHAQLRLFGTPWVENSPRLLAVGWADQQFKLLLDAAAAGLYEIQTSIDLTTWTRAARLDLRAGETVEVVIPTVPDSAAQYYRAVVQ